MKGLVITSVLSPYWTEFAECLNKSYEISVLALESISDDRIELGWSESKIAFKVISVDDLSTNFDFLMVSGNNALNRYWVERFGLVNKRVVYWSEPFGDGVQKFLFYSDVLRNWTFFTMSRVLGYQKLVNLLNMNDKAVMAGISPKACQDFLKLGFRGEVHWLPYTRQSDDFEIESKPRNGRAAYFGSNNYRKGITRLKGIGSVDFFTPVKSKWMGDQWKGVVNSNLISEVMSSYDLIILPSRYDGYGLVAVEGLLAGCKVLVTESCGSAVLANYIDSLKVIGDLNVKVVSNKKELLSSKWAVSKLMQIIEGIKVDDVNRDEGNKYDDNIDVDYVFLKWYQFHKIRVAVRKGNAEINLLFPFPFNCYFQISRFQIMNGRNFWRKAIQRLIDG